MSINGPNKIIKTQFCEGISDISDSYAGFIIDQWGVIHDGKKTYDGVIECLEELKDRGKYVIILSNSGKRAGDNQDRLQNLGVSSDLYSQIITSGEVTWQGLSSQDDGYFKNIGKKCVIISRGGDSGIVNNLDLEVVDDPKGADFLIISGSDAPQKTLEDYEPLLKNCARYNLKAICANPDSLGIMGSRSVMGPGTLAQRYKDFGGIVEYIGKPHQPIFQHCIKILQKEDIYPGQTVMIGDTMAHDILGGDLVNIDTCLVKNGLHASVFESCVDASDVDKSLNILVRQYNNIRPKYLVNTMSWGKALPDRKHRRRAVPKK